MAAVFALLGPRKRAILRGTLLKDGRVLQLQTAKEILAEVFSIRISEVDEMIANRFLNRPECRKEMGPWPQEFNQVK